MVEPILIGAIAAVAVYRLLGWSKEVQDGFAIAEAALKLLEAIARITSRTTPAVFQPDVKLVSRTSGFVSSCSVTKSTVSRFYDQVGPAHGDGDGLPAPQ
jgi:hypothetical protein